MYSKTDLIKIIQDYNFFYINSGLKSYNITDERTRLINDLLGTPIEKAVFLLDNMFKSLDYDGDVCEFGVAQGRTSALMAHEMLVNNCDKKTLHLYDSFKGLPKPSVNDKLINDIFKLKTMDAYAGTMECPLEQVIRCLKDINFQVDRYKIHEGFVDEKTFIPDLVCFAYLDFDFYESTKLMLWMLHKNICKGGRIVIDDYGFFSTGVKKAVDEFYEDVFDTDINYKLEVRHVQASLERL